MQETAPLTVAELKEARKLQMILQLQHVIADVKLLGGGEDPNAFIKAGLEDDFLAVDGKYIVRLRPHVRHFLQESSKRFQILLLSQVDTAVTDQILKALDPNGSVLGAVYHDPALLHPLPNMSIVLDYTCEKWRRSNGIQVNGFVQVAPYFYFDKPQVPVFPLYPTYTMQKEDTMLSHFTEFVTQIHTLCFEDCLSIADAVNMTMFEVLGGCWVCFGFDYGDLNSWTAFLARFGARMCHTYEPFCTHVVASDADNAVVKMASEYRGVRIVSVDWIIESCLHFKRMPEEDYAIDGVSSVTSGEKAIETPTPERDSSMSDLTFSSSDTRSEQTSTDYEEEEENGDPSFEIDK